MLVIISSNTNINLTFTRTIVRPIDRTVWMPPLLTTYPDRL
jgi:hypothetical protein